MPYIAELIDVSEYDNNKYVVVPLNRTQREKFLLNNFNRVESILPKEIPSDRSGDNKDYDIYAELEKKFDELFGNISESEE